MVWCLVIYLSSFFSGQKANTFVINMIFIAEDSQETTNDDAPENNPQYTTVYVGNLAPEASDSSHLFCYYKIVLTVLL